MIETALKAKNPDNLSFEVADATSLRFADNSFDIVVIANALHIIPNPEKALEEIRRVLKDEITRLWKLADKLLRRSKGFKLLAFRNVSPNWYKEEDWTKVQGWIEELNGICYRSRPHMKSVEHRSPKQTGRCVISTTQGFPGDATYSCGI